MFVHRWCLLISFLLPVKIRIKRFKDTAQSSPAQHTALLLLQQYTWVSTPDAWTRGMGTKGNVPTSGITTLASRARSTIPTQVQRWAQPGWVLRFLPLGPATTTSRGATPALLVSTVKDCGILARTAVPRPGPAIFTLLGSTTSFTGTLKGLPGS